MLSCVIWASHASLPLPTASQLAYQQQELVALTHFNMATFYKDGDPACDKGNWATSSKPSSFAPTNLNISNWIESYKAVGVKSGILTAKHGCGFLLWPSNITLPDGSNYGYHVGGAGGIGKDIVKMYAEAMTAAGLPHSFYYSLKDSFFLNAIGDNVKPVRTLLPGQIKVTQEQFEDISVAAVTELWSNYGKLNEIWFDGGISDRIKDRIVPLLQRLQPDAVTMGAGIENDKNEVDWVGTESGMPEYPVWSTGCTKPGGGSRGVSPSTATDFCPKCGDCTLQAVGAPDHWFWMPHTPIKPLSELIKMYHGTVGSNSVMELDFAVDRTGNIDPTHARAYEAFGGWIRRCYDSPVVDSGVAYQNASQIELTIPSSNSSDIDRVWLMEDLAHGQRVLEYKVEAQVAAQAKQQQAGGGSVDPAGSADGWIEFSSGTAVGHKRIDVSSKGLKSITKLRVTVTGSVAPPLLKFAAFKRCPSE